MATAYGHNPFPGGVATGFAPFAAPTNLAPTVDAGPDQLVAYPATVNLDGTVTDDGQPPPGTLTTTWSKISGPGNVTFGDASAVDTTADFDAAGVYVLQLLADDSELQSADTVTITANAAPTVDAGPDQIIVLPAVANLDGTVSDDGLPNPPAALTTMWTKFSGPGNVVFGDASAVDTTATFDLDGVYVLQLEADDSHLQTTDTVTITVGAAPVVESGFPQAGFKAGAFETANFEDADFK